MAQSKLLNGEMMIKFKTKCLYVIKFSSFLFLIILLTFYSCSSSDESHNLFDLKWQKTQKNPIITPGYYGWDSKQVLVGTVLRLQGKFWMWHYSLGDRGKFQIGLKDSKDGFSWRNTSTEPVLKPGGEGEWDDLRVSKPCVIYDGNIFRMWYVGETKKEGKIIPKIGLAISQDGVKWEKYQDNPIFDLRDYNHDFADFLFYSWVLQESNHYKMWFSAAGKNDYKNIQSIGIAHSDDGMNWRVHPEPVLERDTTSVWENFYVANPMVFKKDSLYYMFYGGLGRFGFLFKENIGIARSYDGIKWEKYHDNPVLVYTYDSEAWDREFVTQPRVLKAESDKYYMWYVGADKKNTTDQKGLYQIGLAIGEFK